MSADTSAEAVCVPLALFDRVIRAPIPDRRSSADRVMNGPGLFVQPLGVAWSVTRAVWVSDWLRIAPWAADARRRGSARAANTTRRMEASGGGEGERRVMAWGRAEQGGT